MLLGSESPRVFTPPLRELTPETSAGFGCIEFAESVLGIDLLPWQRWLLIHALEILPTGLFRFRTVIVLVARQNGKSTLAQVLALYSIYVRQVGLVIGTAQNLDIAEEVWSGAVDIAEDVAELAAEVKKISRTNGKKYLELESGSRYRVQTASRRGGRGLSGDLVLLDELREHQNWDAWGAVTKTTLACEDAQIWGLSNAGDAASVVLRYLRLMVHRTLDDPDGLGRLLDSLPAVGDGGDDLGESLGLFEWSATAGRDRWDRAGWAEANPALGHTLTERALASACATDPDVVFRTECLCQWIEGTLVGPFPAGAWLTGVDPMSEIPADATLTYGVDVSVDRSAAHIGVAGMAAGRGPADVHVEVVASRAGMSWVREWFADRASVDAPMRVVVQARGAPVSGLLDELRTVEGVDVVEWQGSQLGVGTGKFWDMVAAKDGNPRLWHRPQPLLDNAAEIAATKPIGDGAWLWDRRNSAVDISPLVAVNAAVWGMLSTDTSPVILSAYESGGLLLV